MPKSRLNEREKRKEEQRDRARPALSDRDTAREEEERMADEGCPNDTPREE